MPRSFQPGRVPRKDRWKIAATAAALLLLAVSILRPPQFRIQRLQSPDGRWTAELRRITHTRPHFQVLLGPRTVHTTPALTNAPNTDLRERLLWHPREPALFLAMEGKLVWGYDASSGATFSPAGLAAATEGLRDRIPPALPALPSLGSAP